MDEFGKKIIFYDPSPRPLPQGRGRLDKWLFDTSLSLKGEG